MGLSCPVTELWPIADTLSSGPWSEISCWRRDSSNVSPGHQPAGGFLRSTEGSALGAGLRGAFDGVSNAHTPSQGWAPGREPGPAGRQGHA